MDAEKIKLLEEGPFPNHFDPWAEKGRYFHQMHGHMIGYLLDQISDGLFKLGYVAGRESSVQITTNQPDIFLESTETQEPKHQKYSQVAATLEIEAGTYLAQPEIDLDRLFVQSVETGAIITVIEFISPNNKIRQSDIINYQNNRDDLRRKGVNVVEIDFTRSIKRLLDDPITEAFPYHIAIYPIGEAPYFIGMNISDTPKTFALPLLDNAYPAELNPVYRQAFNKLHIAAQIRKNGHYTTENLPFPTTISDAEREKLLAELEAWKEQVK